MSLIKSLNYSINPTLLDWAGMAVALIVVLIKLIGQLLPESTY